MLFIKELFITADACIACLPVLSLDAQRKNQRKCTTAEKSASASARYTSQVLRDIPATALTDFAPAVDSQRASPSSENEECDYFKDNGRPTETGLG